MRAKNEVPMSTEERLTVLELTVQNMNANTIETKHLLTRMYEEMLRRFDKVDERFEKMDQKIEKMDEKFEKKFAAIDQKFDRINERLWSNFLWIMGSMIAIAGLILQGTHLIH